VGAARLHAGRFARHPREVWFVLVVAHLSRSPTLRTPGAFPTFAPRLMAMLLAGMRPDGRALPDAEEGPEA